MVKDLVLMDSSAKIDFEKQLLSFNDRFYFGTIIITFLPFVVGMKNFYLGVRLSFYFSQGRHGFLKYLEKKKTHLDGYYYYICYLMVPF